MEEQHERRLRRAEREYLDWSLQTLTASWRDRVAVAARADPSLLINLDLDHDDAGDAVSSTRAMGFVEEARADLADETNLNARLVLERLFLRLSSL
jgi:hypothetical protein